jgi:hypothetical protein
MFWPKSINRQLFPALLVGLGLRLFFILHFPFASGDTPYYEELARNWLYHGVYGRYSFGHLYPSDLRAPGYPGFLAIIYSMAGPGRNAVFLAQAFVDLATCVLAACIAAQLAAGASDVARGRVAKIALWFAVLCPFTANYTAATLTEVLATFLTTLALLVFLLPSANRIDLIRNRDDLLRSVWTWFLGGLVVGIGTLVRPEAPLLLAAVLLVLWLRWWRPVNWGRLTVATLWMTVGLLLPLAPWAARNAHSLGRVQFLAPRYAETFGASMPTGFYAWTKTWMFHFRDAYLFTWKLPAQPIALSDLPSYATDAPVERARVDDLIERYNRDHGMTPQTDAAFAELARERTQRHPVRSYLWIPIERAAAMWLTPGIALLPYSGNLWPPGESWRRNPTDFSVTMGFAFLNIGYLCLALAGLRFWRENAGIALIVAFVVIRTAFLTQLQTCEPRYVLVCIPALIALGAQSWRSYLLQTARSITGNFFSVNAPNSAAPKSILEQPVTHATNR